MSTRRVAPTAVLDIGAIASLREIAGLDGGGDLRIGAMATLADVADSAAIRRRWPALAEAAEAAGDAQVRNRGTIGGSLGDAHPAGDVLAAAITLRAEIEIAGPGGTREVSAASFATGAHESALAPNELITALLVPAEGGAGSAYVKQRHPGSGY